MRARRIGRLTIAASLGQAAWATRRQWQALPAEHRRRLRALLRQSAATNALASASSGLGVGIKDISGAVSWYSSTGRVRSSAECLPALASTRTAGATLTSLERHAFDTTNSESHRSRRASVVGCPRIGVRPGPALGASVWAASCRVFEM